jgi:hypothetical protein
MLIIIQYQLWIEPDPHSSYKTWFYFSVEGVPQGSTLTFCIVNMSNQVKLFKEGHLPVFCNEQDNCWKRIPQAIQQNGMTKREEGFELTFKHTFNNKTKHYFAFSYPWTYTQANQMIEELMKKFREKYFCDYRKLCLTSKKISLNILTVTKVIEKSTVEMKQIKSLEDLECYTFKNKKVLVELSRVSTSAQGCIQEKLLQATSLMDSSTISSPAAVKPNNFWKNLSSTSCQSSTLTDSSMAISDVTA